VLDLSYSSNYMATSFSLPAKLINFTLTEKPSIIN